MSPACATLIETLLPRYVDATAVKFVQGGVAETTELLKARFDHIIYTGNAHVGRVVMEAAAKHLTPVTLELGGKCPAIVAEDADIELTAKRLVMGKCMNAGQVCLAPDYILAHKDVADRLSDALARAAHSFYGDSMRDSRDFGRIVNERHFDRLMRLLDGHGGRVTFGGDSDKSQRYIGLTIVRDPATDSALMTEEIFGPLLPLLTVPSVDAAIAFVNKRDKPLALYVFTGSTATADRVLRETTSGGAVVNDTTMHKANTCLPFGGVGASGMGAYHSHWGFKTCSHRKAVLHQPTWIDTGKMRYPPYSAAKMGRLEFLLRYTPTPPSVGWKDLGLIALTVAVGVLSYKLAVASKQ